MDGFRAGKRLAEISRLAVSEEHRATRLGVMLMKAAYQRCVALGVTHIMLDTYVGEGELRSIYDRMGFVALGDPYLDPSYRCELPVVSLALDIEAAHMDLATARPGLLRLFRSPDDVIDHAPQSG